LKEAIRELKKAGFLITSRGKFGCQYTLLDSRDSGDLEDLDSRDSGDQIAGIPAIPYNIIEQTKKHTSSESKKVGKKVGKKKATKRSIYTPSLQAQKCLTTWVNHRALPTGVERDTYYKIFDDLHRLDKVDWDGETGIYAICHWAVTQWEPCHIQSPSKLRQPSKTYPELKTYQLIQGQINTQTEKTAQRQTPDGLRIVKEDATSVTLEDGQIRLKRKQAI